MEIIAHRGASFDAPENTLAAVRLAWEQGADAVEVDVRLSADRRIVVLHDRNVRRVARVNRLAQRLTLEQLRALDVGRWKGPQWTGERVPLLEEALDLVPPDRRIFIEIKCGPEIFAPLAGLLRRAADDRRAVLIGFDYETMREAKWRFDRQEVLWLVNLQSSLIARPFVRARDVIHRAVEAGFDGLNLRANRRVGRRLRDQARAAGLRLYAWTVDSPRLARRLAALGFDGITTNRPAWLRERM